jgi:beta-glucanase (GH16 family)
MLLAIVGSGFIVLLVAPDMLANKQTAQAVPSPSSVVTAHPSSRGGPSASAAPRSSGARPTPRSSGAPTPTGRPSPTPSASATPGPTPTPTPRPTPTPTPTPKPTPTPTPAPTPTPTAPSGSLVFDDEFNGTVLSSSWTALNRPGDASNQEVGCYRPGNAAVGNGLLVLTTKVDSSCAGYSYTSAYVQWTSFNFLYGTLEVRAKEAGGQGTWPALWLLGANCQQSNISSPNNVPPCNWPQPGSDEIDMTEIMGGNLTGVNQQIHSSGNNPGCYAQTSDVSQNWHVYTLVWQPGSVTWKIDGVTTCVKTQGVPSHPMFLIMNTAVGGFGGGVVNPSTLPQTHSIDYVRVTQ